MRVGDRVAVRVGHPWEVGEANTWPILGDVTNVNMGDVAFVVISLDKPIIIPDGEPVDCISVSSRYEGDIVDALDKGEEQIVFVNGTSRKMSQQDKAAEHAFSGYGSLEVLQRVRKSYHNQSSFPAEQQILRDAILAA